MAMQLSLNKLPWYGQVATFAVISAIVAGGYYYFYDASVQATMAAKQKRLVTIKAELNKALATARKLPEFRAEVGELQARLEGLKQVLPEQKDVGDLLRRLQTLATQSNLEIRAFKPQAITTKQMHAEWPIGLELEGTYHDLGLFFDKVSKVPRIINISNIGVKSREGASRTRRPNGQNVTSTITAECTATTFVLLENPAPPATGAKGAAAGRPTPNQSAQRR